MLSLSDNNQADVIETVNSTSRYQDEVLNIDNPYSEQMVDQIYSTKLQLNKANSFDTEAPFEIVNFPFLVRDAPGSPSYGVYISQLIYFARVCPNVSDFNNRNQFVTAKLLKQSYRYHKIRKPSF